jgi:hypothetical protein
VVLTQVTSEYESQPVITRASSVSDASFEVKLQEEENADGTRSGEIVHYIAIKQGTSSIAPIFKVGLKSDVIEDWSTINFGANYINGTFFAALQTENESDPATVRHQSLNQSYIEVRVEEEDSDDTGDTEHDFEDVGWIIFGD